MVTDSWRISRPTSRPTGSRSSPGPARRRRRRSSTRGSRRSTSRSRSAARAISTARPTATTPAEPLPPDPVFDYRVRDYPGFRRQMLDRLAELVPGFREDDPVDLTTTLVEAAGLPRRPAELPARLGRHRGVLGPRAAARRSRATRGWSTIAIGEGASARVFAPVRIPAGGGVARRHGARRVDPAARPERRSAGCRRRGRLPECARRTSPIVFETVGAAPPLGVAQSHRVPHLDRRRVPALQGATAATLVDTSGGSGALAAGDFLLLVETASPETGDADDARPTAATSCGSPASTPVDRRPASPRSSSSTVEWARRGCAAVRSRHPGARPGTALGSRRRSCARRRAATSCSRIMARRCPPADALGLPALRCRGAAADADAARAGRRGAVASGARPRRPLAHRAGRPRRRRRWRSAAALATVDPGAVRAGAGARRRLLDWRPGATCSRAAASRATSSSRPAIDGRRPSVSATASTAFRRRSAPCCVPRGRFGTGASGNIGPAALAHVVLPLAQQNAVFRVTQSAAGARRRARQSRLPRSASPRPRRSAIQERAVTAADYAEAAKRHEEVANAVAIPRWTGAWQTMLVYVDRKGGLPVDTAFRREPARAHRALPADGLRRGAARRPSPRRSTSSCSSASKPGRAPERGRRARSRRAPAARRGRAERTASSTPTTSRSARRSTCRS